MYFWRLYNNQLYQLFETDKLGFSKETPLYIPNSYLDKKEFVVFRTCHSIGDWGIISSMPRLLKQKYNDCKVYLPSATLLSRIFHGFNDWNHWDFPFNNVYTVFNNNPYVDGYLDSIEGDVYHDHYRIYDNDMENVPLIKQMLKFWKFKDEEMIDYLPELYFSDVERAIGDRIIKDYVGNDEFGTLLLTNTKSNDYGDTVNELLIEGMSDYKNLKYFYYGHDIKGTKFESINVVYDFKKITTDIRVQLYIKTKAKVNIGYQSGINDVVGRYSKVICTPSYSTSETQLGSNYLDSNIYLYY